MPALRVYRAWWSSIETAPKTSFYRHDARPQLSSTPLRGTAPTVGTSFQSRDAHGRRAERAFPRMLHSVGDSHCNVHELHDQGPRLRHEHRLSSAVDGMVRRRRGGSALASLAAHRRTVRSLAPFLVRARASHHTFPPVIDVVLSCTAIPARPSWSCPRPTVAAC